MKAHHLTQTMCLGIAIVLTVVQLSSTCTISQGWQELTMEERLVLSDIVVYGKTKQHVASTANIGGRSKFFIDAIFEVYCVLKSNEEIIDEEITIEAVAPRDGCSGTNGYMGIESEAIVGLRKGSDGKFVYDEVMPTLTATFSPSRSHLFAISQVCGIQQWQAPTGTLQKRCPICGISNFTEASLDADVNEELSPCVINGINFGNGTDCNLFQNKPDNTTVCIPTTYSQTCHQILVFESTVTCDCSKDDNPNRNGNFIDVSLANRVLSVATSIVLCFGLVLFLSKQGLD